MNPPQENVVKFPTKVKLVCSGCGAPGEGSCGCGVAYISPGERAEAAVKASPNKSARVIAEETGINRKTLDRARAKTTGTNVPVEKRTGKDGKARKQPKPRGSGKTAVKYQDVRPAVREALVTGQPLHTKQVAAQQGVSVDTVERAALAEQARIDVLKELNIDPTMLAPSAQAKLEAAKRAMEHKLKAEYATRIRVVDEEVRQRVLTEGKEYLAMLEVKEAEARETKARYLSYYNAANAKKPPLTEAEWELLRNCAYPDDILSAKKKHEAFLLIMSKKEQLTGIKDKKEPIR